MNTTYNKRLPVYNTSGENAEKQSFRSIKQQKNK